MTERTREPGQAAPAPIHHQPGGAAGGALTLATLSFALSFAAWGLIGGLASVFASLYGLTASQTALLVAVPVLLGSLARLPMGILTDRFGGRLVFTALLAFSSVAAFLVTFTTSYASLLVAAFLIGMAGSSLACSGTSTGLSGRGRLGPDPVQRVRHVDLTDLPIARRVRS